MDESNASQRRSLIHLIRGEKKPEEAAAELGRSRPWAYKWWKRYRQDGWDGLAEQSRAPKRHPNQMLEPVRAAIRCVRSELEAENEKASDPCQGSAVKILKCATALIGF